MGTCCCKNSLPPYNYLGCETKPGCPTNVTCYYPYYRVCWGAGC
ncbi:MAG: hypothetical protein A4E44_00113 [Methanosaeta sp. PtaB.Bin018]|nr:MAG: hypothetical protein A4E44_00113 [Methanosaeta sp. PtaB.Bin018]